jgi:hypothetical protein
MGTLKVIVAAAAAAAAVDIGGEGVVRAYTPISGDRDPGVLEFLIKVRYLACHVMLCPVT